MSRPFNPAAQGSCSDRFHSQHAKLHLAHSLNHDHRLSFVLDLDGHAAAGPHPAVGSLAFCNPALLAEAHLHGVILGLFSHAHGQTRDEEDEFAAWIRLQTQRSGDGVSKAFFGALWTVVLLPDSWAVISGIQLRHCDLDGLSEPADKDNNTLAPRENGPRGPLPAQNPSPASSGPHAPVKPSLRVLQGLNKPTGDVWPPLGFGDSPFMCWIREFDWASTSLGPTEAWPRQLKHACEVMFGNPDPATVFWGHDLILIYNEAYIALAGNKHPAMMGGSARVHWKEVWDLYDPLFDKMFNDGIFFQQHNSQLFIQRSGYLEEGFFNMRVMPILGDDGSVVGFYEPVSEVTKQVLWERRMHMLLKVSQCASSDMSLRGLWRQLLDFLGDYGGDVHFAMMYHRQNQSKQVLGNSYSIEGAVGSGLDAAALRQTFHVNEPDSLAMMPFLREAHESSKPVVLNMSDGTLSPLILEELGTAGLKEAPRACIVCPLSSTVDDSVEALLILGTSPHRPYDEDYELFVNLLLRQIESSITFVKLLELEKKQLKQQAMYEGELRFKRFAENAQVGIFSFDPVGNVTFCNESWLELSGHDRNDMSAMSWTNDVHPDNAAEIKQYWDKIVNLEGPQTFEVRYKKPWRPPHMSDDSISLNSTWVVASAYAEVSETGECAGVLGCATDVSSFKWVDQLQSQRLSEALELKRQQENFLDITSHEMRNPLNAILHCAAELIEMLPRLAAQSAALDDCLDAARTISYCGRHQKRIIDDVLTLSKLDSNLLSISPIETRPLDVVEEVLKVFDTEIRASSISAKTELAKSYTELQIDTVLVDPHRLTQILINLIANAVKFTKGESLRSLHVVVGAHAAEPVSSDNGVRYVPSGRRPVDPTVNADWGTGDVVFLHFSVQDTGPGMTREEADRLFNRFIQASPRTHVQYGGSGLGLFISRELAELHGGRIGISSEVGYGSTFDFYVKGRKLNQAGAPPKTNAAAGNKAAPLRPRLHPSKTSSHALQTLSKPSDVHVLIVEDNLINQKILAKLIRKQGWTASVANHGQEALAAIDKSTWHRHDPHASPPSQSKLDVVLADIEMPVMNGKEFVRRVRQLQGEGVLVEDIPIVAVTGNARTEQINQAQDCGFDEVVSKPYKELDIVTVVCRYVRR
ncbi:hypothetical protein S40288_09508 [Stachybotrys chartarum IBT 40288]|nr:hypothetical protein S40288_09508 [Stachybotrys chartarum IBT 40288]